MSLLRATILIILNGKGKCTSSQYVKTLPLIILKKMRTRSQLCSSCQPQTLDTSPSALHCWDYSHSTIA